MGTRGRGARPLKGKKRERPRAVDTPLSRRKRPQRKIRATLQEKADVGISTSRVDRNIQWVQRLPITSGLLAGQQFHVYEWQRPIFEGIYRTDEDGRRIVRQALITTPRGNGKTGLSAALVLLHFCGPEAEQRGQIYSAAADRHQATLIFNEAKAMVLAVPELAERVIIRDFTKQMEDTVTGSIFQALSSDAKTKHGFSASCIVYDELAQAPNRDLYDVLQTSTGKRAEPLTIVISTQSSDSHSIMAELVDYGTKVRDRVLEDPTFFSVIYTAPEDADPWSEDTWFKCNPALGTFRSLEEMRSAALQAQRIPARENAFRLLYLNQRVSADSRFINQADWDACAGDIDPEAVRGRPCYGGLDLSSTTDLTALVLYFPEDSGAVLPFFWVPLDRLDERERSDKVPYRTWHRSGYLEAPNGRAIDRIAIIRRIAELASAYDIKGIAYDRWRLEDLKKLLDNEGISIPITKWGQGFQDMGPAVDALEAAILNRTLKHSRHPVLTWNVANAVVEIDPAGSRKITKEKSVERVDGLVALVMAVGLHARAPKPVEYDLNLPLVISA
jgi:phage terminase large subunit-like protein